MTAAALASTRARDLVARFRDRRVLVVGDLMLDRFIVGQVSRVSPEAPVPIVRCRSEFVRLGGAANVGHNLAVLGARVTLLGVVGPDQAAERLREALDASHVDASGVMVDPRRTTTEKVRVVTERNQQVARLDYESDEDLAGRVEDAFVARVAEAGRSAEVVLVSDYLKGAITARVMAAAMEAAEGRAAVVVDPKVPHLDRYAGATVVTPNHHEAEAATHVRINTDEAAKAAARQFRTAARCESVLITRGEHGMWLSSPEHDVGIPAVPREVADVTGAGDTVVATLALALAANASLLEAAILANQAASRVVEKFGPATVAPDEILDAFG